MKKPTPEATLVLLSVVVLLLVYFFSWHGVATGVYESGSISKAGGMEASVVNIAQVTHQPTPNSVRAIYVTAYVAGLPEWRGRLLDLINRTELNAVVIDIKDYTGVLLVERAPDFEDFIRELHDKNIYVIGRVSTFQDQAYVLAHPSEAVRRKDNGDVWRDRKGIAWIDPGSRQAWSYVVDIAKDYYAYGFDEINFDYIRFPSDGDMKNVSYTLSDPSISRAEQMKLFYKYLDQNLHPEGIVISADLFGMTTTNRDDLGIGQVLENALLHFDFVAPMVYPSHYPPTFNGWANPNKVPGELIEYVMGRAVERAVAASTTPSKLRPWLQDFDYGGDYGEAEVRAQINGVYNAGLDSWMMWDPGVKYTESAYDLVR